MLKYIQYQTSQDFFDQYTEFVSNPIVICPNPQKADEARLRFDHAGAKFDCLTISKFMQDQIESLLSEEESGLRKNKSTLTLFLGSIWKKLKKDSDYMGYLQAFNIFTELRSYSVESSVIEGVLELYDEDIAQIISVFQTVMTDLNIIDEHGSYNLLTQRIREGDLPVDYEFPSEILLYGFETMTASQLDLLKILSTRTDIGLLIHQAVLENSSELDWVGWLKTDETETVPLIQRTPKKLNSFEFSPGFIGSSLPRDYDILIIGAKKNHYHYIQEIPFAFQYKQSVDLFSHSFQIIWERIENFRGGVQELKLELQTEINRLVELQKFLDIKVCFTILNKVHEWEEISDENQYLSEFDLKIIKDASQLDLPRINKFDPRGKGRLIDLSQMEGIENKKIAIVAGSQYQRLNFSEHNYTDSIENYLASIGPLRSSEFEFNLYHAKLKELALLNDVDFYIEQGLLKSEKQWKRITDQFELDLNPIELSFKTEVNYFNESKTKPLVEKISSSRLQVYHDCPRKYYYSYVEKREPKITLKDHLDSMELGQLQHKIIEVYLTKYDHFDEELYLAIISETLDQFLKGKDAVQVEGILVETRAFTQKVILSILKLSRELQLQFVFEKDFSLKKDQDQFVGSIDCFGSGSLLNLVLDFKRSGFSFTSQTGILDFEKNQLWFYLSRLVELELIDPAKPLVFGYIDLSDISNSLLFSNDKEILKSVSDFMGGTRNKVLNELNDMLLNYQEFEKKMIEDLRSDHDFLPKPIDSKTCDFCFQSATCSRGGANG